MIKSITNYIRDVLLGSVIFITIVVGITYLLQDSLILVKQYDAYTHWAVVLFVLPAISGVVLRLKQVISPLFSCLLGATASTAILYPLYKDWWATPPQDTDVIIYLCIVFGIAYFATQPLKATFMLAFKIGRFSMAPVNNGQQVNNKKKKGYPQPTDSQPIYSQHGSAIAMMELLIGVCSLGLSIFSVFFLGRG